ncbi:pentapeptide repeat-containing protein [Actinoplanes sp. NPDC051851]|uniref:pentapeptide repeat-containing protein n=1 Tax=Actinoplanes sp. NPDC051851 TaxID=3154753 RepID=UPI00342F08DB
MDFSGQRLDAVDFSDTRFTGETSFAGAEFTGPAVFARAVFDGPVDFTDAGFRAVAVFGRTRFRGPASFDGARFDGMAWFGRGEESLWDDDEAWETVDEITPLPWDEVNEADPHWPVAVLMGDYQDYEEGGDGARFNAAVSFRGATFRETAWFGKARFAETADFSHVRFHGGTGLGSPAVDLTGAVSTGAPVSWPWGWSVEEERLVASAEWAYRNDPVALAAIGDADPDRRQEVVDAICASLRVPLSFPLTGVLSPEELRVIEHRRRQQETLASRLRGGRWAGMRLELSGATLVDLDLTGCEGGYAEFCGAQFHGTTHLNEAGWKRLELDLGGGRGRATFHG